MKKNPSDLQGMSRLLWWLAFMAHHDPGHVMVQASQSRPDSSALAARLRSGLSLDFLPVKCAQNWADRLVETGLVESSPYALQPAVLSVSKRGSHLLAYPAYRLSRLGRRFWACLLDVSAALNVAPLVLLATLPSRAVTQELQRRLNRAFEHVVRRPEHSSPNGTLRRVLGADAVLWGVCHRYIGNARNRGELMDWLAFVLGPDLESPDADDGQRVRELLAGVPL